MDINKLIAEDKLNRLIFPLLTEDNTPMVLKTIKMPGYKIVLNNEFLDSLPLAIQERVKELLKEINS